MSEQKKKEERFDFLKEEGRWDCFVNSVSGLIKAVGLIIAKDKNENPNEGARYYFRGEEKFFGEEMDPKTRLESHIDRKDKNWLQYERDFFHEAYRKNPNSFVNDVTMVDKLTRMQHYRLPTRFADLSCSALLATYFACEDYKTKASNMLEDGNLRVFKVHPRKMKRFNSNIITAIAHLPLIDNEEFRLDDISDDDKRVVASGLDRLAYEIRRENPSFSVAEVGVRMRLREDIQQVWAFEPILNNNRIRYQEGIFLAFGCRDKKQSLDATFSAADYNEQTKPTSGIMEVGRVTIDAESKDEILTELRSFGVLDEMVYPDLSDCCKAIAERRAPSKDASKDVRVRLRQIAEELQELTGCGYAVLELDAGKFAVRAVADESKDSNVAGDEAKKNPDAASSAMSTEKEQESAFLSSKSKPERNEMFWVGFAQYCADHELKAWWDDAHRNKDSYRSAGVIAQIKPKASSIDYSLHFLFKGVSTVGLVIYVNGNRARNQLKESREKIEKYLPESLKINSEWERANHEDSEFGYKRVVFTTDVNVTTPIKEVYKNMVDWMCRLVKGLKEAGYLEESDIPKDLCERVKNISDAINIKG